MTHQPQLLLSIGSFASAARLSLKALRLYDQLDVLKPSFVDPDSGYRYYHLSQLRQARLIRMMRQMEMPLAAIGKVLAAPATEAERLVRDYWQVREARIEQMRQMMPDLIDYLHQAEIAMTLDITVKTIAPQPILSLTHRVQVEHLAAQIGTSLDRLYEVAKAHGNAVVGAPFGIYHGPINHDDDGPIEVCLPVQHRADQTAEVSSREVSGGKMAAVWLAGEQCQFPAILAGYDALIDWIRQHGYETIEPPREIWHRSPAQGAQMEVIWPFQSKSGQPQSYVPISS